MLNKHLFLSLLMAVSTATVSAETHHVHWSYTGENDAAHWGDLSEDFAVCKTGKQQSPVDFSTTKTVKGKQLAYRYNIADYKVENNGHTLQAMPQGKAQTIVINGKTSIPSNNSTSIRRANILSKANISQWKRISSIKPKTVLWQ